MKITKVTNMLSGKVLVISTLLILTTFAFSQTRVDLEIPNSMPCYCQETSIWCGAAVTQMILEGYPGGLDFPHTQTDVWNTIQSYKDDTGVGWASDPDGIRETLMDLGAAPGVNWSIFAKTDKTELMYNVAYWMNRRNYPVAVLINDWAHWVAIVGIETDVDPLTNSTVNLQWIKIFDPWSTSGCPTASSGGVISSMPGTTWYSTSNNYLDNPGNYPASKWNGNFIAVIEPPVQTGKAVVKDCMPILFGKPLPPKFITDMAYRWMTVYNLCKDKTYQVFKKLKALTPVLVNQYHGGYYLVPFGYENGNIVQGAMVLNAYTGAFEEIGAFQQPRAYLTEAEATRLARDYVSCECEAQVTAAELIYTPFPQTPNRYTPVWRIKISSAELQSRNIEYLYVTQLGIVLEALSPQPLGD